jgi:hypothetical protein
VLANWYSLVSRRASLLIDLDCTELSQCANLGKVPLHPSFREVPPWAFVGKIMLVFYLMFKSVLKYTDYSAMMPSIYSFLFLVIS